jgi:hypothetical protein
MFQEGFLHENYDNGILEKENFSWQRDRFLVSTVMTLGPCQKKISQFKSLEFIEKFKEYSCRSMAFYLEKLLELSHWLWSTLIYIYDLTKNFKIFNIPPTLIKCLHKQEFLPKSSFSPSFHSLVKSY